MTARDASVYRCQQCGYASPKAGTCPDCLRAGGGWVQLVEERPRPVRGKRGSVATSDGPRPLKDITMQHDNRVRTGIGRPIDYAITVFAIAPNSVSSGTNVANC